MKTLQSILIAILVVTSMANASGQSITKPEKRNSLIRLENSGALQSHKVLADDYHFSMTTGSYSDLSSAISINKNQVWDDPSYAIPIGFNFDFLDTTLDSVYFGVGLGGLVSSKINSTFFAEYVIIPFETDLIDRGDITGTSQSPISYKLEGATGNRVLKIEWKNAGFYDEGDSLGTLNDYINFQLWLFEGTNDIEMHFGSSMITNPSINYYGETGAIIGLADTSTFNILSGPPNNPILVDSIDYLIGTPSDGTIYRFSKYPVGIEPVNSAIDMVNIFPNPMVTSSILRTSNPMQNAILTIHNGLGQIVKQIPNITGQTVTLYRDNLSSGLYFIQLTEEDKVIASDKLLIKD